MYHHTKFGKKWLSGSGDIEQTQSDTLTELQMDRWMDRQTKKVIPIACKKKKKKKANEMER